MKKTKKNDFEAFPWYQIKIQLLKYVQKLDFDASPNLAWKIPI